MAKTQTEAVLEHLETHLGITSMEAYELYGATRLSAIIYNLRKRGHNIVAYNKIVRTRYGKVTHCSEYRLEGAKICI